MRPALLVIAAALSCAAQPARLTNGHVETRAVSGGLQATMRQLGGSTPVWIAYSVPIAEGEHHMCGGNNNKVMLEGAKELVLFYRVEQGEVKRMRTLSEECEIDAGGAQVYWLTGVNAADSVALLQNMTTLAQNATNAHGGISYTQPINAIGLHRDASAIPALIAIVERERNSKLGRQAMNILGRSNDPRATTYLGKVLSK